MSLASLRQPALDWVFDLDNTLYPAESTMYDAIGARMTAYIARSLNLDHAESEALQERYFDEYGATVVGLARHHGIDAADFLAHVHDVEAELVHPDPELRDLIARLPGRKFVFTNGGGGHAERIVERLGLNGLFADLFDIESAGLEPKPQRAAYTRLIERFGLTPQNAVLIEDTSRNLIPAAELGFITVLIGTVHPEPAAPYVHHHAHDLKALLREIVGIDPESPSA